MSTQPASASRLFAPLSLNPNITLSSRLVMAPLTRFRSSDTHVPVLPMMATYYSQRASYPGSLLITEATFISPRASGYNNVPGIWNEAQISAWKQVTDAVHAKECFIFCQLWALGRTAKADVLQGAEGGPYGVVSSSATPLSGQPAPRPLTVPEIQSWVSDYAQAARNAIAAGFDGVEIHGANGYLIDQFTQDTCNTRTDAYGGSIENRSRFGLAVAKAVVDAVGAERTGIRLSPFSIFQEMKMKDPVAQFTNLLEGLKQLKLAYVHVVESRIAGNADVESSEKVDFVFDVLQNVCPVFIAGGFNANSARQAVDEYKEQEVAIVFGRYYISNPDLVWRIKNGVGLTKYNRETFYAVGSEAGYIDYPFSEDFENVSKL